MKLEILSPETVLSQSRSTTLPIISFTSNGQIYFNRLACDVLSLKSGSGVIFAIDDKNNAYLRIASSDESCYTARLKASSGTIDGIIIQSMPLVKRFRELVNEPSGSMRFLISSHPDKDLDKGHVWFPIITSYHKQQKELKGIKK